MKTKTKIKDILVVQGGSHGFESKGLVVETFCRYYGVNYLVRAGQADAGHVAYYKGKLHRTQQIPTGWTSPRTNLVLGAGASIDENILRVEIENISMLTKSDVRKRLFIDSTIISVDTARRLGLSKRVCDTKTLINEGYDKGELLLVEGDRGLANSGLSPSLKYETVLVTRTFPAKDMDDRAHLPNEISWEEFAQEVNTQRTRFGLKPMLRGHTIAKFKKSLSMVATKFGMPNADFTKWGEGTKELFAQQLTSMHEEAMGCMEGYEVERLMGFFETFPPHKRLCRIARPDINRLKRAAIIHRPKYIVLTFLNYAFPTIWGMSVWKDIIGSPKGAAVLKFIKKVEKETGTEVRFVNTSPNNIIKIN